MARAQATFTQNGTACSCVQLPVAIRAKVMTPMVFWASLVPWASEINEADPTCPHLKPRSRCFSSIPRVTANTSQVPTPETMIATTGETRAGRITFPTTPSSLVPSPTQLTPPNPRPAMVAPTRPPNRAWDELDGRLHNQVKRFHKMAPTRPDNTINSSPSPPSPSSSGRGAPTSSWRFTTALVTVSATSTERKAPTRFSSAESITAVLGFSAPVAMDVAMALPVS